MTHLAPSLHRDFHMSVNEVNVKRALDRSSLFSLQTFDSSILLIKRIILDFCMKSWHKINYLIENFESVKNIWFGKMSFLDGVGYIILKTVSRKWMVGQNVDGLESNLLIISSKWTVIRLFLTSIYQKMKIFCMIRLNDRNQSSKSKFIHFEKFQKILIKLRWLWIKRVTSLCVSHVTQSDGLTRERYMKLDGMIMSESR